MNKLMMTASAAALLFATACGKSEAGKSEPAAGAAEATDVAGADVSAAAESVVAAAATAPATNAAAPTGPEVTAEERAAALAHLGLVADADGKVKNDCGDMITPQIVATDMEGAVGRAILLVMGGGPTMATCYGDTGMQFFLLKPEPAGMKRLFAYMGHFAPMETKQNGVRDFAVGGPGFEFPVYSWNGTEYVPSRMIPDTEFPASLN